MQGAMVQEVYHKSASTKLLITDVEKREEGIPKQRLKT